MADKRVTFEILTKALDKIKTFLDEKAEKVHTHLATDITEDNNHRFITDTDKAKIDTLQTDGDGKAVYHNDGTFKPLADVDTINDAVVSASTTYSSTKITNELNNKADAVHTHTEFQALQAKSHDHTNKNVLDDITLEKFGQWNKTSATVVTNGNGTKSLMDDGTYKLATGGGGASNWDDLVDKPFDSIGNFLLESRKIGDGANAYFSLEIKQKTLNQDEYDLLKVNGQIDENTLYIIEDKNALYIGELQVSSTNGEWFGTRENYENLKSQGLLDPYTTYYTTKDAEWEAIHQP